MQHLTPLIVCVVIAGLAFDFVNGFHDASNSVATIIATRVLKPRQAILWAAFFNVVAVLFFGTGVAATVGSGLVALDAVTPMVVLCGLLGATAWGLTTWRLGLPSSSSHALLGGYAGSAMANHALLHGWRAAGDPIILAGWIKVLAFIVIAPLLGLFLGWILMKTLFFLQSRAGFSPGNKAYKRIQLLSSAFLSLTHGGNDAQKTAGILTSALVAGGNLPSFDIPLWILGLSYITMGLGTLAGGWRVIRTMGFRLTKLTAQGGVCAESGAALSILCATLLNLPVSTTHVTTGAILGVGAAKNAGKVHWSVGRRIVWAWIITIPVSACIGACIMAVVFKMGI